MPRLQPVARQRTAVCADAIARAARDLAARGWMPATSGNLSLRLDDAHAVVSVSGRNKAALTRDDVVVVDIDDGHVLDAGPEPSAETPLHVQIYRRLAAVGAVVHTHSHGQSVASRLFAPAGVVSITGWELQKAIHGIRDHDGALDIPVFPNTQHMPELVAHVDAWLDAGKPLHAYLIAGHGMYAWGRDMDEACRHVEALDFLLGCELDVRRLTV